MTIQINVPFMIPPMSHYFQNIRKEYPNMKMGATLCSVGNELNKHLQVCGNIIARLEKDGWTIRCYADACQAQHQDVTNEEQLNIRLKAIGVDIKNIIVSNTWDDWFDKEPKTSEIIKGRNYYQYYF